jgi:hypothetical protein
VRQQTADGRQQGLGLGLLAAVCCQLSGSGAP